MKFIKKLKIFVITTLFFSCSNDEGKYNCKTLISSQGEQLYIKSLNWGVTSDNQISIISQDNSTLQLKDTSNTEIVKGLQPFVYKFEKDTLTVYFNNRLKQFSLIPRSINITYINCHNQKYTNLIRKSMNNTEYYTVPEYDYTNYQDVPEPTN